ncbi:hypothetical protein NPIL_648271 [Nephila pilipes]|uniref:Uncharacterized protein n=1 Tax=Nephila pilipes TaxID=299642 RepID=A0A8X6PKC6_NEPPI|nr:hypothetical protein NPIL_648271 [Nephila pilipes]
MRHYSKHHPGALLLTRRARQLNNCINKLQTKLLYPPLPLDYLLCEISSSYPGLLSSSPENNTVETKPDLSSDTGRVHFIPPSHNIYQRDLISKSSTTPSQSLSSI